MSQVHADFQFGPSMCRNCAAFDPSDPQPNGFADGVCRRMAPRPVPIIQILGKIDEDMERQDSGLLEQLPEVQQSLPPVCFNDYCLEWFPRGSDAVNP